ncbi:MAG TPA: LAGLIDADG family homing endonuclease [Candidatus Paceibacterota bacterium]|nr:LAGLIDADG family homing endonuclease [Candidatus Paceibacterota bacterium]
MAGIKPKCRVDTSWRPELAYAIGLITTDGNLSKDGRHIELTSNDKDQLENFLNCLKIKVKIGYKTSGYTHKKCTRVQFGDINFYRFLTSIGLMPNKTKVVGKLAIPNGYFFDFLRGHFDGDGTFYSYFDPRWRSSFMFYTVFLSASENHILWIRDKMKSLVGINGHLDMDKKNKRRVYQLKYAKSESLVILSKMYYNLNVICLKRKRVKVEKALKQNTHNNARVLELEDRHA